MTSNFERRYPPLELAAVLLAGIASVMTAALKPMLITLYITNAGLGLRAAGLVLTVEMLSAATGALLVSVLVVRVGRARLALLGLLLLLGGDLLCATRIGFPALFLLRMAAGLGSGFAAGAMAAALSGGPKPERYIGIYNGIAACLIAVGFLLLPRLATAWGMRAVFVCLALTTLPALAFLRWFPNGEARISADAANEKRATVKSAVSPEAIRVVGGIALFYMALGGAWPLMAEIGRAAGLDVKQTGEVLSITQILSALGSFAPAVLGGRVKRSTALTVAIVTAMFALLLLLPAKPITFAIAAPLFIGAAMVFFAYVMGVVATIDPLGRVAGAALAVQTIGLGVGPAWSTYLVATAGYPPLILTTVIFAGLALIVIPRLARRQEQGIETGSREAHAE